MLFGHDENVTSDGTFDSRIYQGAGPTCALRSQQIILRDYGIQIPQRQLVDYAEAHGWFGPDGTPGCYVGNLLDICGVGTHRMYDATVSDLVAELKAGHRVIVSVDSNELWAAPGTREYEFYRNIQNPDHALIVSGLKIDPYNPRKIDVVLTDPGSGDAYISYPLEKFHHAWGDGHFFMVATDEPAPYQYNEVTQMMEPSGFLTEYAVRRFPFDNELREPGTGTAYGALFPHADDGPAIDIDSLSVDVELPDDGPDTPGEDNAGYHHDEWESEAYCCEPAVECEDDDFDC